MHRRSGSSWAVLLLSGRSSPHGPAERASLQKMRTVRTGSHDAPVSGGAGRRTPSPRLPSTRRPPNETDRLRERGRVRFLLAVAVRRRGLVVTFARREEEIALDAVLLRVHLVVASARRVECLVRAALDDEPAFDDEATSSLDSESE